MKKIRTVGICVLILLWALLAGCLWFGPKEDYTDTERRPLSQMPELSLSTVFHGKFAADFEEFTLDQFPLRDTFRQVKSMVHYYVLRQSDNNGLYLSGDTVAKLEYPLNESSVTYAAGRLRYLYDTYLRDTNCQVYASLIPDKGYYLTEKNGYPALDYTALKEAFLEAFPSAEYVDLFEILSEEDYYRTDTHWRQEHLLEAAQHLCQHMGTEVPKAEAYREVKLDVPFYGVYFGQAALPMKPEEMVILQSDLLDGCTVTDPLTGAVSEVYNMDKLTSPDLYDVFLSGSQPIVTIENPLGQPEKELVIFRDSYGSSLAPLLLQGYSRVTLVDIRYIHPDQVGDYVSFAAQDVLFLYSSLILNNSRSLK